jgi:hypothetical protein
MFINGSHTCSKKATHNNLCDEHKCKTIRDENCNICLGELKDYVHVICGHSFHKECIGEWLKKNKSCPCCRKFVKTMSNNDIDNALNDMSVIVNAFGNIILTRDFVDWVFDISRTYINDVTNISLMDILYVIQLPNQIEYFTNIYFNERNNISVNLFQLEDRLNQIANNIRDYNMMQYNDDQNESQDEEIEYGDEDEEESEEESENENEYEDDMINIDELEFTEF